MTHRLPIVLALICGTPGVTAAGLLKVWQLKEAAAAPVLVTGRVVSIEKGEPVAEGSVPWKGETLAMTAEVQVLRSYVNSGDANLPGRIRVRFLAYGPTVTGSINGYPPPLPRITVGQTLILPLRENPSPVSNAWQLIADSGMSLVIPAREEVTHSETPPASARAFVLREISESLSLGTPAEVSAIAGYLASQNEDLRTDLMPLLEPSVGDNRQRWAEIATNLLAAEGIPRPPTTDLLSGKLEAKAWSARPGFLLAQSALQPLKPSPETEELLIQTWLRESPLHAWGSANALLEFAEQRATIEGLRQSLESDTPGSSYIAWVLAHGGHRANLPEALERALKVADRPDSDGTDLQGAAALLRDFGSDQQLQRLAGLVRKYQIQNRDFYHVLWQYATGDANPREGRVLAVVLNDRRVVFDDLRYCDLAVAQLERATGQHFGTGGKSPKERDDAVAQSLAWLKAHGIAQ